MNNNLRKILILILNILIFGFMFIWIKDNIDFNTLNIAFHKFNYFDIFIVACINFFTLLFYAKRLSILLNERLLISFNLVNLAYGLNSILPFRMGDIVKLAYAKKIFGISVSKYLTATFIEKGSDILILSILLSSLIFIYSKNIIDYQYLIFLLILFLALFLALFFLKVEKFFSKIIRFNLITNGLKKYLINFNQQVNEYNYRRILIWSFILWMANIFSIYYSFSILLNFNISIVDALSILLIIILAVAIPSAPAAVGVFEAGIMAYLIKVLQIDTNMALISAIVFHLCVVIPQLAYMSGIIILNKVLKSEECNKLTR